MTERVTRFLTPELAGRLAITRQRLAGPRPRPTRTRIMSVVRDLGCLQLDPISVVARSMVSSAPASLAESMPASSGGALRQPSVGQ